MATRLVHRLLQSRRALPSLRRSSSPAKVPPSPSLVFSNEFSSSSGDDSFLPSFLAEYLRKLRAQKAVGVGLWKMRAEINEYDRLTEMNNELAKEIFRGPYEATIVERLYELKAMGDEATKSDNAFEEDFLLFKNAETVEDLEKVAATWKEALPKLKKMKEARSEINAVAGRIADDLAGHLDSSPPSSSYSSSK